jgi:hypothetical protein
VFPGGVKPHDDANGYNLPIVAVENLLAGKSINDEYQVGQKIYALVGGKGFVLWMWLEADDTTAIGDHLVSGPTPGLIETVGPQPIARTDGAIVGTALEVIVPTVPIAVPQRIRVEIA